MGQVFIPSYAGNIDPDRDPWSPIHGWRAQHPAADDNKTMQAAHELGYIGDRDGHEAAKDVGIMEMRWDEITNGLVGPKDYMLQGFKNLVPYQVAQRGVEGGREHQQNVVNLIQGAAEAAGMSEAGPDMIRTYRQAVDAAWRGGVW